MQYKNSICKGKSRWDEFNQKDMNRDLVINDCAWIFLYLLSFIFYLVSWLYYG
jgi:hypothetical protein